MKQSATQEKKNCESKPSSVKLGISNLIAKAKINLMSGISQDMKTIKDSSLFDSSWYLEAYPDVKKVGMDPCLHFCQYGWKELRNPSARFNSRFYLTTYPDVANAGMNPLVHFIKYGQKEKRQPLPPPPHHHLPNQAGLPHLLRKHPKAALSRLQGYLSSSTTSRQ